MYLGGSPWKSLVAICSSSPDWLPPESWERAPSRAAPGKPPRRRPRSRIPASADAGLPAFLQAPEPITDFADTREYDIVVVGAGESGLSAAHSAVAAGAKVACVQNIGTAQTTGNMGASVDTTKTDEAGIQACVAFLMEKNAYRSNRKLLEAWARNSYEAVTWWADTAAEGGAESKPYDSEREYNGYTYYLHANTYNHLEGAHNDAALAVCDAVAAEGVEFFFNSPAVQLYKEGERVAGVICETEEGNALFKASKGVILASGDCSGNQEMRDYYCPDLRGFKTMSPFRDGMGMMTGIWAGAQMTPVNHSKMVHGGGALTRLELPFLNLDIHGERFMNEVLSFAYLNNLMRGYLEEYDFQNPMAAKFFTIMPANWAEIGEQWTAAHPEEVKFGVGNMKVPSEDQFVKGETFAELAANINAYMEAEEWHIDPIDEQAIVASIEAYNELCATGSDGQFGKRADYLVPIEQGPFFAVPRGANSVPAVLGIAATLLARRIVPLSSHHWARFGSLAAMLAASLCLIAAPEFPSAAVPLATAGALLGAFGFCAILLMFNEAIVPLSLIRIALFTAASRFIAVPMTYLCQGLAGTRFALVLVLLPLLSLGCLALAFRSLPERERVVRPYPKFSYPWKPLAVLCIYAFAYGMRTAQLPEGAGVHSSLSTALVMGGFFVVVYFFSDRFSVSALFRSPLLLMVCGVLLIPAEGVLGTTAAGYLISMGMTLMSLLISLLFYDLSKRMGIAIVALTGIMRVNTLFTLWGAGCTDLLGRTGLDEGTQSILVSAAVVMLVLASTLMLLSERDLASRWGIKLLETETLAADSLRAEAIAERCDAVSASCHLSPREDEICRLIASGKTNQQIERELFIASGTLKAHIQHIYVKCDVHSRKELIALCGGE